MGKKNKKNTSRVVAPSKMLPQDRKELTMIVDKLFALCTKMNPQSTSLSSCDWNGYMEIYKLVEDIREREKNITLPFENREDNIEPFMYWLHDNGVKLNNIEIVNYKDEGLGLRAKSNIVAGDEVIRVPNIVMMSEKSAQKSALGSLIKSDPLLTSMGNISLALHVLSEKINPNSFWQPYLRVLPSTYNTTLYFTPQQMQLLKGSPQFEDAMKQYKFIARQYSYFYKVFLYKSETKSLPMKDYFTYDAYRWAVSTVMTRQNLIPETIPESSGQLALIPAWDMANHREGFLSTDYSDAGEIVCQAFKDFKENEQFTIYYGQRSNADFFLHSGFVYEGNESDSLSVKLGVSKKDPLYEEKAELLNYLSLPTSGTFELVRGLHPISPRLLAFTRIFCMDKESLSKWKEAKEKSLNLMHEDCDVGTETQDKTWSFLHTRVMLLTKSYPTTLEEDLNAHSTLDGPEALISSLIICEKKILKDASAYLAAHTVK